MDDSPGQGRIERLRDELEESRRRIDDLETLGHTVQLLDSSLDSPHLFHLALRLALRVLCGDAALLVTRDYDREDHETAHSLVPGESAPIHLEENPSRLAHEVLQTREGGVRRGTGSPGAIAAAERMGTEPALRVATPLLRRGRILGVLEVAYRVEPPERFRGESAALRSVADHLAIALDSARLAQDHARQVRELGLLNDISTKISAHLDLDELLDDIVDSFLALVPADATGIFLIDRDTGRLRKETLRGYEESDIDDVRLKLGKGILGWVATTGEGIIVPDVSKDDRYVPARVITRSEMAAPLRYEGRVIGVFNLESDRLDAFRPRDFELLLMFSNHAAISIMNAHLHAEASAKQRLEEQLSVARDIHTRLLPREAPAIPGHVLVGRNIPSSAVGGDYFDFLPLPGGRWGILVADVSGNGIPAGLIMAGFRSEVRACMRREDDPRKVLAEVNEVLARELEAEHFVTAFLGIYSPESGTLVYSSAGHEPGLLVRADGSVEQLTEGGLLLGVFPEAVYGRAMVHLGLGDRLLLYTDGFSDGSDSWGDRLGIEGILRLLAEATAEGVPVSEFPDGLRARAGRSAGPGATQEAGEPGEPDEADEPEEADDRTLVVLARDLRAPELPPVA